LPAGFAGEKHELKYFWSMIEYQQNHFFFTDGATKHQTNFFPVSGYFIRKKTDKLTVLFDRKRIFLFKM